jgi:hypothetical protein
MIQWLRAIANYRNRRFPATGQKILLEPDSKFK